MPNYDAGHYFLTVLAPVRPDPFIMAGRMQSRRHALRDALSAMPNGETTVASQNLAPENPFSRTNFTHFARFFVLDDVVYNGRVPCDGVVAAILNISPLRARKIDRLSSAFLVFVADFDVAGGSDAELDLRLSQLWATMGDELTGIFRHCTGFAETGGAAGFCAYIKRCRVETTMPFNDYWSAPPNLPVFDLKPYIYAAAAAAGLLVAGLFVWRPWLALAGFAVLGGAVFMVYRRVTRAAARPFPQAAPPSPRADLPTVLKALAVQRGFTRFAIESQGKDDQALYEAFGAFVTAMLPDDLERATQPPGVIS